MESTLTEKLSWNVLWNLISTFLVALFFFCCDAEPKQCCLILFSCILLKKTLIKIRLGSQMPHCVGPPGVDSIWVLVDIFLSGSPQIPYLVEGLLFRSFFWGPSGNLYSGTWTKQEHQQAPVLCEGGGGAPFKWRRKTLRHHNPSSPPFRRPPWHIGGTSFRVLGVAFYSGLGLLFGTIYFCRRIY